MSNEKNKSWMNRSAAAVAVALALHGLLVTIGCDSGGGGGADGRSTVQGTVNSFSVAGNYYAPSKEPSLLPRLLVSVADLLMPPARAAVAGVSVSVQGTDISGTTDGSGNFILSGVPGGQQVIVFSYNGQTSTYSINVPGYGNVELSGISVNDSGVTVSEIEIEEYEDESENENENGNDNDDGDNDNEDDEDDDDDDNDNEDDDDDNDNEVDDDDDDNDNDD